MNTRAQSIRACPLCGFKRSSILFIQKFTNYFCHEIASCADCGFVFVRNTPSQKFYDQYYKKMSKYEGIREHETHFKDTGEILNDLAKKYIKKSDDILDVGCSTGSLLFFLKNKGYKKLFGFDPGPKCKKIAKEKYDIEITTSSLKKYTSKKKYKLIILSQVLEHLSEVRESIDKISRLLTNDGYVFIGIPDAGRFYEDFEEPFGEFSTEHINFFSDISLFRLMKKYSCAFIKSKSGALYSLWQKDSSEEKSIIKYIKLSEKKLNHVKNIIDNLPSKIIVWGAGSLSQRLLETTTLKNKAIKFVDMNKNLVGKKISDIDIISDKEVNKYSDPILISSFRFRSEIKKYIKSKKYRNKIITF